MTPSEQILKTLQDQNLTRAEIASRCTNSDSTIGMALKRLHERGSIKRTKQNNGSPYVYSATTKPETVDLGTTPRQALKAACSIHPELAAAILNAVMPPVDNPAKRRVRRTPTSAKYLGHHQ